MFYGQYSWLDVILDAIAAQIVTKSDSKLSTDTVFDTLATDEDHVAQPPGDFFCTITPVRFPADQGLSAGQGRYTTGFDGQLRIANFARFASDQELKDSRRVKDATRGLLAVFLKTLDALHHFSPLNASGECMLKEPMRIDGFDISPRRVKGSPWAVIASMWQVKFIVNLPSGNS